MIMKLRATILASLLVAACAIPAAAQYDDDIYYNPKKDTKAKAEKALRQGTPKLLKSMDDMDIDVYNRRGRSHYGSASDTIGSRAASAEDFKYTQQIQRFYNPTIVVENIDQLEDVLANSVGNIEIVTDASGLPYLYSTPSMCINWRYDPAFSWARAGFAPYLWGAFSPWGYNGGWYDPWYAGYWGPGFSWSWNFGPSWGWGPSWNWGWNSWWNPGGWWGPAWGPAWGGPAVPSYAMRPHGNSVIGSGGSHGNSVYTGNNHRTTAGQAALNRTFGGMRGNSSIGTRPGTVRPSNNNSVYRNNNHRSSTTNRTTTTQRNTQTYRQPSRSSSGFGGGSIGGGRTGGAGRISTGRGGHR